MEELTRKSFSKVLLKATLISFIIFSIFARYGAFIFERVLSIHFASFRIFGGIVIVIFAIIFIVQGRRSFFTLKGSLDDLAAEIALPFLVGAATVSLSVIIGNNFSFPRSIIIILISLIANFAIIILLTLIKYNFLPRRLKIVFDKTMIIFLRLNGFLIGAIGLEMITGGVKTLFFASI
jgi:multiple antibiotic resistance protein